jgi:phosphoglucomutase
MPLHPLAGKPAPASLLIDVARLREQYYSERPDPAEPAQRVSFGTSGHRGSAARRSFNEAHVLAVTQAVCEHRRAQGVDGPLYLGMDTHALSAPAQRTALEVLAAHDVEVRYAPDDGATPTPVISHAILSWNRDRETGLGDGIVITPSHNPPEDGGIKYNPPHGGPAGTEITRWIERRANELLPGGAAGVRRVPCPRALAHRTVRAQDLVGPYVDDLGSVLDLDIIREAGVRIGVDPMGGASLAYWRAIGERYRLALEVVNPVIDPTFAFMPLDHDGKIRMDCSSPYAMARLVELKNRFAVAFGNDADADRHGIVTPGAGLLPPNHYLAVAVHYLCSHRPGWSATSALGKTLVSSALIDRVVGELGRRLFEVPVGFKWFVEGLLQGDLAFGGEESAGASFLRKDGTVWTTDKDGILLDLLAAEILARTGRDPAAAYQALAARLGEPQALRIDRPASPALRAAFSQLDPDAIAVPELAGEPVLACLTRAPGNGADIGGFKIVAPSGWFAVRPSGTEDLYKLYAESFRDAAHLGRIIEQADTIVGRLVAAG